MYPKAVEHFGVNPTDDSKYSMKHVLVTVPGPRVGNRALEWAARRGYLRRTEDGGFVATVSLIIQADDTHPPEGIDEDERRYRAYGGR